MYTSNCSYMVNQNPFKYGYQQEDYQSWMNQLKKWGGKKIQETPKEQVALEKLFFELFAKFNQERQEKARDHQTTHAEQFGRRRDKEGTRNFYITILSDEYKEYNQVIIKKLAEHMRSLPIEKKNSEKTPLTKVITDDHSFNIASTLEIEILEGEHLNNLQWNKAIETKELAKFSNFPLDIFEKQQKQEHLTSKELEKLQAAMKEIKQKDLPLYKRLKMTTIIHELQKEFPSPGRPEGKESNRKSFFVLATSRLEVKKQKYATTQYFTWLYRDFQEHPIDRMLKYSTVFLIHQDNFLIENTLQEISTIFAKAVLADKEKLNECIDWTGVFRYYFTHAMPDERGSEAVSELFEGSIYEAKKLEASYLIKKQIGLEALTNPLLSTFLNNYKDMINVVPKKS